MSQVTADRKAIIKQMNQQDKEQTWATPEERHGWRVSCEAEVKKVKRSIRYAVRFHEEEGELNEMQNLEDRTFEKQQNRDRSTRQSRPSQ